MSVQKQTNVSTDCIFCGSGSQQLILPLGDQPLSNAYLSAEQLSAAEPRYPLNLFLCDVCMLVHNEVVATSEEIFSDYAYFSSYSTTWLEHAKRYVDAMTSRFGLDSNSFVVEVASNDGYLLQYFVEREIPCLGIEPAQNVAAVAREKGVPTEVAFWGVRTAERLRSENRYADLILGNNVLAHVPTLNDFVGGLKVLLKPSGVITMEFPHLYQLIEQNQFDTIYHEHFSYFSLFVVRDIFAKHGLTLFDVDELPTHGGSLRIYARHDSDTTKPVDASVERLLDREASAGMREQAYYTEFAKRVENVRDAFMGFLDEAGRAGKSVVGYGAPAKGNTFLNYCGLGPDRIPYTVDRSPYKQGRYLPGSRIPIFAPDKIRETKPDYVFILPWNLKDEIMEQMKDIRDWGGRFVVAIPTLEILESGG